jgi:hypothetical protein
MSRRSRSDVVAAPVRNRTPIGKIRSLATTLTELVLRHLLLTTIVSVVSCKEWAKMEMGEFREDQLHN